MSAVDHETALADDLLAGAAEISEFLGWPRQRVQYRVRAGLIPVVRIGRRVFARKSELERFFRSATNQGEAA